MSLLPLGVRQLVGAKARVPMGVPASGRKAPLTKYVIRQVSKRRVQVRGARVLARTAVRPPWLCRLAHRCISRSRRFFDALMLRQRAGFKRSAVPDNSGALMCVRLLQRPAQPGHRSCAAAPADGTMVDLRQKAALKREGALPVAE